MTRWHFRRAYTTALVVGLLIVAYAAFSVFLQLGWHDAISLGLVLQRDWLERGGRQWVALLANGFVTFSLQGFLTAVLTVLVCLPWLERRVGRMGAVSCVFVLALALGPIKIALGAPGAVGASKFIPMLQLFWLADNPLLVWISREVRRRGPGRGRQTIAACVRYAGWVPAAWLGWSHVMGGNPAHWLSAVIGLALAASQVHRTAPWGTAPAAAV